MLVWSDGGGGAGGGSLMCLMHDISGRRRSRRQLKIVSSIKRAAEQRCGGRLRRIALGAQQLHDVGAVGGALPAPRIKQCESFFNPIETN